MGAGRRQAAQPRLHGAGQQAQDAKGDMTEVSVRGVPAGPTAEQGDEGPLAARHGGVGAGLGWLWRGPPRVGPEKRGESSMAPAGHKPRAGLSGGGGATYTCPPPTPGEPPVAEDFRWRN